MKSYRLSPGCSRHPKTQLRVWPVQSVGLSPAACSRGHVHGYRHGAVRSRAASGCVGDSVVVENHATSQRPRRHELIHDVDESLLGASSSWPNSRPSVASRQYMEPSHEPNTTRPFQYAGGNAIAARDAARHSVVPLTASRAHAVRLSPDQHATRGTGGAVTSPPGNRRRHNSFTRCGTGTGTVAVPERLARNIGQSPTAAGAVDTGADEAAVAAGAARVWSTARGAMQNVPCTCQQSQARGIQYKRPLAGTTPSKHPGRTTPS